MALASGDRIGPYEILAALGAGGMGQVYRARDTKLNRIVAVKALHESFAGHPERVARFEREAQLLASLNHPNIAAIYGVEEAQGSTFLVLEFVDGQSLGDLLKGGPLPAQEAVALARQAGDALAAAHERGIIHRDFKPGNVMVTGNGQAKVLDFGLGKSLDGDVSQTGTPSSGNSPTMTTAGTQAGMIMGTAGYMSPEQAKGRPTDRRTDVWAFGCVLFEMLTGRKAFDGEDVSETLASILRSEPDWASLPGDVPPHLKVLLERCLIKDRADRLADMSVVRFLLSDTAGSMSGPARAARLDVASARRRGIAPFVIAAVLLTAAATFGLTRFVWTGRAPSLAAVTHVSVALPDGIEVGSTHLLPIALSRDGMRLAFVGSRDGKNQIFVRALSEPEAKPLDGTEGGDGPFFSPDGQWVAFFAGGKLRKIAVGGAALQTLADAPFHRGGDWSDDGFIYFAPANMSGIWRVPEGGGAATEVTKREPERGEISHRWPQRVGANALVYGVWTGPGDDEHAVAVQTIGKPERHVLVTGADAPRYSATSGLLFYTHLGELFSVPWKPSQDDLGRAVPVAAAVHPNDMTGNEGCGNYAVSDGGTLAYIAGGQTKNAMRLVWIDRAGTVQRTGAPDRPYENVVIAPDGTRAIVQIRESVTDLWSYDFARNTLTQIATGPGSSQAPLFTPDGSRVIYRATRKGLRNISWRAVDGSGTEEQLTLKPDVSQTPTSVSPDGRWLVYNENNPADPGGTSMWLVSLQGDRTPRLLLDEQGGEYDPQFSPDGRWIAYQASVSSRQEIFVMPFPGPGPRRQVSTDGGQEPLWSHDGRELFFQGGTGLVAVDVTASASSFSAGAPHLVHTGRFFRTINGNTSYGVTADGKRFLRIQQVFPEQAITRVELVQSWFSELAQRGPRVK